MNYQPVYGSGGELLGWSWVDERGVDQFVAATPDYSLVAPTAAPIAVAPPVAAPPPKAGGTYATDYAPPGEAAPSSGTYGDYPSSYGGYSSGYDRSYGSDAYASAPAPASSGGWDNGTLGSFGDPTGDPTPRYATGMTYDDYRNRQQFNASNYSGGGTRPLPPTQGNNLPSIPGQSYGGDSSGGGGGGSLAAKIRANVMGNLYGMKIAGGTGDYPPSGYPPPASSGKAPKPPKPVDPPTYYDPRETGFSNRNHYDNESLYDMIYTQPQTVIPDAVKGINLGGPGYDQLTGLPVGNLAMITGAAKKNWRGAPWDTQDALDWTEKNTNEYGYLEDPRLEQWKKKHTNEYGSLTREVPDRMDTPTLPDKYKTNPSDYANTLASIYDQLANTSKELNRDQLWNDLTHPAKGSQMDLLFSDGTKDNPSNPSTQMGYANSYLGAIADATMNPWWTNATMSYGSQVIDEWGNKALRGHGPDLNTYLRRQGVMT